MKSYTVKVKGKNKPYAGMELAVSAANVGEAIDQFGEKFNATYPLHAASSWTLGRVEDVDGRTVVTVKPERW